MGIILQHKTAQRSVIRTHASLHHNTPKSAKYCYLRTARTTAQIVPHQLSKLQFIFQLTTGSIQKCNRLLLVHNLPISFPEFHKSSPVTFFNLILLTDIDTHTHTHTHRSQNITLPTSGKGKWHIHVNITKYKHLLTLKPFSVSSDLS